jgi:hypothetical protein
MNLAQFLSPCPGLFLAKESSSCSMLSGAVACVTLAAAVSAGSPVSAAANFTFTSAVRITAPSRTFTSSGINLTVDNPLGNNITSATSRMGTTGGINTDISNGLCVALYAAPNAGRCQYLTKNAGSPTLTGLTFTFDRPVRLIGFDIFRVGAVESGVLSFSSSGLSETFAFQNPGGSAIPSGSVFKSMAFSQNFVVEANVPIALSTAGTVFTPDASGSFRINNFSVEPVPGPAPVLGLAAAYGCSRRIRRKLKSS